MTLTQALAQFEAAEQYVDGYRIGISENPEGGYDTYVAKGLMPPHFTNHVSNPLTGMLDFQSFNLDSDGWQEPEQF